VRKCFCGTKADVLPDWDAYFQLRSGLNMMYKTRADLPHIEVDQLFLFDLLEQSFALRANKPKVDLFRLRLPNNFGLTFVFLYTSASLLSAYSTVLRTMLLYGFVVI
jgi:hypothetical protein